MEPIDLVASPPDLAGRPGRRFAALVLALAVASVGALIFIGAAKEDRYCLPNIRFLLHQPSGGIGGKATDMMIQAEQLEKMRKRIDKLFSEVTGQTPAKIRTDRQRDFWLNTDEALDYGFLGKVIRSVDELS